MPTKIAERENIDALLASLTPREEKIIRMLFSIGQDGKTVAEIAEHFDRPIEQVWYIIRKARRKIEHPSRSKFRPHVMFDWPDGADDAV